MPPCEANGTGAGEWEWDGQNQPSLSCPSAAASFGIDFNKQKSHLVLKRRG